MDPFARTTHLIDDHHYAIELVDSLDSGQALELHIGEHGFGAQWPHSHPAKEGL